MEMLQEYVVPITMAICFAVGFIIKKWVKDVDNKFIPTTCAILGVIVTSWINGFAFTPEILLGGLASGLAATGIDQAIKQITKKTEQ